MRCETEQASLTPLHLRKEKVERTKSSPPVFYCFDVNSLIRAGPASFTCKQKYNSLVRASLTRVLVYTRLTQGPVLLNETSFLKDRLGSNRIYRCVSMLCQTYYPSISLQGLISAKGLMSIP